MDKIVDHLFVFRGQGIIEDFPGNYSDFRVYDNSKPNISSTKETIETTTNHIVESNKVNKLSYNEQKEFKNLESKIRALELDKIELEKKFSNLDLSQEEINKLSEELQTIIEDIESKEMRWFELAEKFESS